MDLKRRNQLFQIVQYASRAPSTHNVQPWKFTVTRHSICIFPDFSRQLKVCDPKNRELYISLGCALENLVIALRFHGFLPKVGYFCSKVPDQFIKVQFKSWSKQKSDAQLFSAILKRHTNRKRYNGQPIPEKDIALLKSLPLEEGIQIEWIVHPTQVSRLATLVMQADHLQLHQAAFRNELTHWLRFNRSEARTKGDGLFIESMGHPAGPRWLGSFFSKYFPNINPKSKQDQKFINSSPALIVISSQNDTPEAWIKAGRSFERFILMASTLGIQYAPMNQPIEVPKIQAQLKKELKIQSAFPLLLIRLGYARRSSKSIRRPIEDILIETPDTLFVRHSTD